MATSPFEKIRASAGDTERSVNWYQQQIKKISGLTPNNLIRSGTLVTKVTPGHMYMFFYDAKHKDKLPYWDMFPLVFPFRAVEGGFLGINLHYMPYLIRAKLLGRLHEYVSDDRIDENRRLQISWNMLNNFSTVAPIKNSVKHYLNEHIQSKFVHIQHEDWLIASQLPVERFVGANKTDVWKNSQR
jgi:hypothetical protein